MDFGSVLLELQRSGSCDWASATHLLPRAIGVSRLRDLQHASRKVKLADRRKYYAIVRGADGFTGIVREWYGTNGGESLTDGVSSCRFKGFKREAQAVAFIAQHSEQEGLAEGRRPQSAEQGGPAARTDGVQKPPTEQKEPSAGEQGEPEEKAEEKAEEEQHLCIIA